MEVNDITRKITSYLPCSGKSNCAGTYRVFFVVVLCIVIYFPILRMMFGENKFGYRDKLNTVLVDLPGIGKVSGWPLTHFLLFFIMGILFPDCDVLIMSAGVLWEVWEECFGRFIAKDPRNTPSYMSKTGERPDVQYTRWWAGSVKDIAWNAIGYYSGKLLAKQMGWNISIPYINDDLVK